ncbi:MAG: fluoride efflux transporter CrcB [Lachnospira sp.]
MFNCIIVGLGGFIGAVLRYLIGKLSIGMENGFPVKTLLINVAGAFVIGIVAALAAKNSLNPRLVLFLKVGICGGFTTFSSFALETDQLLAKGQVVTAVMYVTLSVVLGVMAVYLAQIFATEIR